MQSQNEQWIQTNKGVWLPKGGVRQQSEQQGPQEIQQGPESPRAWGIQRQSWQIDPAIDQERQQFLLQRLKIEDDVLQGMYPFKELPLDRADIEWLVEQEGRSSDGDKGPRWLRLQGAILNGLDLMILPLKGADFRGAQLEGTNFWEAQLEGANFERAQLKGAHFGRTQLEGADFGGARLEGADFWEAQLEGVDFKGAQLEDANFGGVRLGRASFGEAHFANTQGVGPRFANAIGWDEVFLAHIKWSEIKTLGEEAEAKKRFYRYGVKKKLDRLDDHRVAVLTYRQLATALETQGLKEEAGRFAYRAHVMQRKVLWWHIWQEKHKLWSRVNDGGAYLFSVVLAVLTGYGYRFGRSLVSYICVLSLFAFLYLHVSTVAKHPLEGIDALILSISDLFGRGFFRQDLSLSDPYAGWSVLEGMIGVCMDVLLISTLTQRLFKK